MNQYFIPHIEAMRLSKLGFNEPCMAFYTYPGNLRRCNNYSVATDELHTMRNIDITVINYVTAPLYQQAFDWLEAKLDVCCYIAYDDVSDTEWGFRIYSMDERNDIYKAATDLTKPEAQAAALRVLLNLLEKHK